MSLEVRISLAGSELPGDPRTAALSALQPPADTSSRSNSAYAGGVQNMDWSMPGAVYAEDVLPIRNGYTSVSKTTNAFSAPIPAGWSIVDTKQYNQGGTSGTISGRGFVSLVVKNDFTKYFLRNCYYATGVYNAIDTAQLTYANQSHLAIANCNGRVFVVALSSFTSAGNTNELYEINNGAWMTPQTLVLDGGVTSPIFIRSIAGSGSYLLVGTDYKFYYCQAIGAAGTALSFAGIDAGVFVPTGYAGGLSVLGEIANGIIAYTSTGGWTITQTFNGTNPFKAVQISGLPGVRTVATAPGSDTHYAHTETGIFGITLSGAKPVFSHMQRYLLGETGTTYNRSTGLFTFSKNIIQNPNIYLYLINHRYLVLQRDSSDELWIYDQHLDRWGMIRDPDLHIAGAVHGLRLDLHPSTEAAMLLISSAGVLTTISGDNIPGGASRDGVMVIGPIARGRNDRLNTITEVLLVSPYQDNSGLVPSVKVLGATGTVDTISNTQDFFSVPPYAWLGRVTDNYLYIAVKGSFEVQNLIVKLSGSGF